MNINNINNGDTGFIAKTKINTNFQNTKISIDNLDAKTVKQSLYADLPTPSAGNNRHYYQTEQGIYKSNGSAWIKVGYTLADLDALLNTKANQSTTYTQAETNTLLDLKQANITASNGVQKVGVDVRGVDATTSAKGVVQLSNTYNGNSQILATTEKALNDGLAIKQNAITTGTTAQYFKGNLSLSNFATDAQNAVVEDAINNEVTNKAPSQNAVFDALALKAPLASPTFTGSVKVPTPSLDSEAVPKSYADGLQRVLSAFGRTGVVTAQSGDYSATQIINTPAGNISATSVQAAINELDNEKQANIGYTPENVANKENITLDTSSTKYPTNNLVKTYTDAKVEDQIIDGVTTKAPSQNVVFDALALKAPLSSPALTGTPTAPTASVGTNTTQIATTQYVKSEISSVVASMVTTTETTTTDNDFVLFSGTSGKNVKKATQASFKALLALTKSDVGLNNVQNIDTTNPANIIQSSTYKFVTDTEKDTWNEKISSSAIKNTKTLYVSGGVNGIGSDANNGFSELSALNTLATANGKADGSGWAIKQLPSQLTESVTFTHPNLEFLGTTHRDNSGTTGTITSNPSSGSQTYSTYSFTNFSKLGSGCCILTDVSIKTALNDTGSGDIDIINSALSTALLTFTGSGAKRLYNCRGGSPVVNNASAFVYIVNNQSVANPILTAGTLALENCIVYVTQGATLTLGTAGSTISLNNVRFIYPDSTEATINIPTGVIYSFAGNNLYKSTSTINGTDISLLSSNYIHNVKINTLNLPNRTALQRLETDANKNVVSVAKGTADNQDYSTTVSDIKANGAGSLGSLPTLPRADHIHPTDTTREASANKVSAFTGTPNNTNYPTEKLVKDSLDSKLNSSLKGAANGLAELGSDLKVPISQLPTFLTLGETSSTAYAGDKGKIAYDHSQIIVGNPHNTSKADVGLNNVQNIDTTTTANITDSLNKRFVTDAQITKLNNTTGVNSGDQDLSGYLLKSDNLYGVDSKQTAINNLLQTSVNDSGKILAIDSSGNVVKKTLTSGGNMVANLTGATGKIALYKNDTGTEVKTVSTALEKQIACQSLGITPSLTTTEIDSLTWATGDLVINTTKNGIRLRRTSANTWVEAGVKIGEIRRHSNALYAGGDGFIPMDGSEKSRTIYAELFEVISTTYGAGDGSTTFNVPDVRGRVSGNIGQGTSKYSIASTSVSAAADTITLASTDDIYSGTPIVVTTSGTMPAGLTSGATYYAIKVNSTTIKLATSLANVHAGTSINITSAGSGTHTLTITLTNRTIGTKVGEESHLSLLTETAPHTHQEIGQAASSVGAASDPLSQDAVLATDTTSPTSTNPNIPITGSSGGGLVHNNMQPTIFDGMSFIFAGV